MNRTRLKEALKKIIKPMLNEITLEPAKSYGIADPDKFMGEIGKDVKSFGAIINFNRENGKITIQDETGGNEISIELVPACDKSKCYNLTAIYNKSDREVLKNLELKDIREFLKLCFKDTEKKSYVEKAYDKNTIEKKSVVDEKEDETDKMTDVKKIKKQIDFKPKDSKERDIDEVVIGISTMKDASKFKKQSDAKSQEKVTLKSEKENASKEKLVKKFK